MLLARQAVVLDDSVQTRGNLRAALLKSPAAIGVLRGAGEGMSAVALSPDRAHARRRRPRRQRVRLRHGDAPTRRHHQARERQLVDRAARRTARTAAGSRSPMTPERGNVVTVFDSESRRVVAKMMPPPGRFIAALRYSADGTTLDTIAVPHDPDGGTVPAHALRHALRPPRARSRAHQPQHTGRPCWAHGDARPAGDRGKGEVTDPRCRDAAHSEAFRRPGTAPTLPTRTRSARTTTPSPSATTSGAVRILDIRSGAVAGSLRTPRRRGLGGRLQLRRPHARHRGR